MAQRLDRAIGLFLLALHAGLLLWAAAGFVEFATAEVLVPGLANPLFSPAMLFAQWTAIGLAGAIFLAGWLLRWRRLPEAMIACYLAMAAICAVQTFTILQNPSRFVDIVLEYAAYIAISAWLLLSPALRRRLGRQPVSAPA